MKRMTRSRRLTPAQTRKYGAIRQRVGAELPDLIRRHAERITARDHLHQLLARLKAAREAKGLSLADLTQLTGMDRSALSKLETGRRANPTVDTLMRYAEAVGKHVIVTLADGAGP